MAAPIATNLTLADDPDALMEQEALYVHSPWLAIPTPEPMIGDLEVPALCYSDYNWPRRRGPRARTRIEFNIFRPESPGLNQVVPSLEGTRQSVLKRVMDWTANKSGQQKVLQTNPYWLGGIGKMSIAYAASLNERKQWEFTIPLDIAPSCHKYWTKPTKPSSAPLFVDDPLKLREEFCRRAFKDSVSTGVLHRIIEHMAVDDMDFPGGFKQLRAYDGFICVCPDGTARKSRILHHVHTRKNVQTARAFGSVKAPGDSDESYGVPPDAHISDGSSSGTSAGDSRRSIPEQLEDTPMYDAFLCFGESKPEGDRRDLRPTIINDKAVDEEFPVLLHVNPRRGSTSGGEEIYLIVKNLPSTTVLYARFGYNIAPTSRVADGVLACHLPPGTQPGVVDVTLCQAPSVHEKSYGRSLVSFEYDTNTSRAVALLSKLLSGTPFTEVTPATQGLLQGSAQGSTIARSDSTHSVTTSFPESAFIEVLAAFKSLPDFEQRLSTVNLYRQSLLHLAVHLRYRELAQRLVDWGIDINIKDMTGHTALHTAYLCGELSTARTLELHVALQLSLDILGRPPLELASDGLEDHNTESHLNDHF